METERGDQVETEVDRGVIAFLESLTAYILVAVLLFPIAKLIYQSSI